MKLILAQPTHSQAISEFYNRLHGDSFQHKELLDAPTVSQLLRDQELAVIIAADEQRILGCGMGWPKTWNQSFEIGALSVDHIEDRGAVGKALFEAIKRLALKQYGLAIFRAGSESAFKRGLNMGAACWGFWHKPGGRSFHEDELMMGFFNQTTEARRVEPPQNSITMLPFAQRLLKVYGDAEASLPYPKNFPVGSPRGTGAPVLSGRVWPTYHSQGNYISIESTAGPLPLEIIREFVGKVRQKGVSDVRMALPVNQEEAYINLLDFGFRPTSYLPGWFVRGPYRYDCVELVAGLPSPHAVDDEFVGKAIKKIFEGFGLAR